MTPRQETIRLLEKNGFVWKREGKKHTIYWNPKTGQPIPVKRHDFNENDEQRPY